MIKKSQIQKKILIIFILLNPLIDLIYSINFTILKVNLPINQLIRSVMLVVFISFIDDKKQISKIIFISIILIIDEFYHINLSNNNINIYKNIGYSMKILYFFSFILFMEQMLMRKIITKYEIMDVIVKSSYIISLNIILSAILGIGFSTYSNNSGLYGVKGFFTVQNTINASLLMILPCSWYMYKIYKNKIYLISLILNSFSLILLGTKSGLVGCIILFCFCYVYWLISSKNTLKKAFLTIFSFFIIGLLIIILYPKLLVFINEQKELFYTFQYNDFYTFLLSNRTLQLKYLQNYINCIYKGNIGIDLFGLGYSLCNNIINTNKVDFMAIEMDFYGLFYYSGAIIMLLVSVSILKRVIYSIITLLKDKFNQESLVIFLIIIIALTHSFFAGHVIYEAQSVIYLISFLAIAKEKYMNIKENSNERRYDSCCYSEL